MAALQKIRSKGAWLVASIAIALFLFVIGDAIRGSESFINQSKQTVGSVDGESLSIQDYQKMVEDWTNYFQIAQQQQSLDEETNNQIKDQAWNSYVQLQVIESECEKLGLAVTDNEVAKVIQSGESQFLQIGLFSNPQTGRYDYATLQMFLSQYQAMKSEGNTSEDMEKVYNCYLFIQRQIRSNILMQKYYTLLSSCFLSNKVEAKMAFDNRVNETKAIVAAIPFASIDNSEVEVSDDDIKNKYNEKKENFHQYVELRDAKIVDVQVQPSAADKAALAAEMDEAYSKLAAAGSNEAAGNVVRQNSSLLPYSNVMKTKDAFPALFSSLLDSTAVGTTTAPVYDAMSNVYYTLRILDKATKSDSILFRQIGVSAETADATAQKADSIVAALAAGSSFKELAKKYGQVGDSTWLKSADYERTQLDADNSLFINTLSGMGKGETKKVELSSGATVILQVLDVKNPIAKYNVAAVVKELKFSDETYSNEYNKFSAFISENNTLELIEANAEKNGYSVRPMENISMSGHSIAGIRNTRDAVKWLFDEAKNNEISPLYECGSNDHLLVVALTAVNEKGFTPLDKVKDMLREQVVADKKAEKILAQCTSFDKAAAVKGAVSDTINRLTFSAPAFIAAAGANELTVSAVAAKTAKGQTSEAVRGNAGVYMLKVLDKTTNAEKFDEKTEKNAIEAMAFRRISQMVNNTLYVNAKVEDLRYRFF